MTTELHTAIRNNREELRQRLLEAAPAVADRPEHRTIADWPTAVGAAADFAMLLTTDDMPPAPFEFGQGRKVVDAAKFLASLQSDVRRGPRGPRARPSVLHAELLRLRDLLLDAYPPAIEIQTATDA